MKQKRQTAILSIIGEKKINTHSKLIEELNKLGFCVTQATVSRDIKELGIIKVLDNNGRYIYSLNESPQKDVQLNVFSNSVIHIDFAQNIVVIKTHPGTASAVAASLDETMKEQILGSIAGDDTVFMVTHSLEQAKEVCNKLCDMIVNKQ